MTKQPVSTIRMVDQIGGAIATADGTEFKSDPSRYRRLALAALKPLTRPTEAMVDAAYRSRPVRRALGCQQPERFQEGCAGDDPVGDE